jgi:hypothetical protein
MALLCLRLNPMLREHLTLIWGCTLNELVSTSIEQENACRSHMEEEERKKRLCLGLLGVLRPNTAWSAPLLLASHMVNLHLSNGVTVHLSRWPHTLQSTCSRLLHLELHSLLG